MYGKSPEFDLNLGSAFKIYGPAEMTDRVLALQPSSMQMGDVTVFLFRRLVSPLVSHPSPSHPLIENHT